jgi:hypothetical protein
LLVCPFSFDHCIVYHSSVERTNQQTMINRRMTDNTMVKRERTNQQTMVNKTLLVKLNMEQQEPH